MLFPSLDGATTAITATAEMVTDGHPDKYCDQVADAILDEALRQDATSRAGIECLAKDTFLIVSGEIKTRAALDIEAIARNVWETVVGYGPGAELTVVNHVKAQSRDIAVGGDGIHTAGVDSGGAGDQGVMVGYATDETPDLLPLEYVLARSLAQRLRALRWGGEIPWLRPDGKAQVTIRNGVVTSCVLAAHHAEDVSTDQVRDALLSNVIKPVMSPYELDRNCRIVINGTGRFTIGGPRGDAGVVGRKIVVDAYGPRIPVGGGAYSGKDPSKVDRSGAYMARTIAKSVVTNGMARECQVVMAFGIGQRMPETLNVYTSPHNPEAERWVQANFCDLRPEAITEYLNLRRPKGWSYCSSAAFGHYGREGFPWEQAKAAPMERTASVA